MPVITSNAKPFRILMSTYQADAVGNRIAEVLAREDLEFMPVEPLATPAGPNVQFDAAWFTRDLLEDSTSARWAPTAAAFFERCEANASLRWLHSFSSGTDFLDIDKLLSRGVKVSSSIGANGTPLGRSAFAGLLAISRGFLRYIHAARSQEWRPLNNPAEFPVDLEGQTVIVVGLGAVGKEVARLCKTCGMRVVAIKRSIGALPGNCDEVLPPTALLDAAREASWIVLACPLTNETRGLVGREVLAALPTGAGLINVARGGVVDEAALHDALASGHLRGAYLDVFAQEPLPSESGFWTLPNVLVSPHNGALSTGNEDRIRQAFFDNLASLVRGEQLANLAVR